MNAKRITCILRKFFFCCQSLLPSHSEAFVILKQLVHKLTNEQANQSALA